MFWEEIVIEAWGTIFEVCNYLLKVQKMHPKVLKLWEQQNIDTYTSGITQI